MSSFIHIKNLLKIHFKMQRKVSILYIYFLILISKLWCKLHSELSLGSNIKLATITDKNKWKITYLSLHKSICCYTLLTWLTLNIFRDPLWKLMVQIPQPLCLVCVKSKSLSISCISKSISAGHSGVSHLDIANIAQH